MDIVIRVVIVYVFIMIGLRVLGKREFGQLAPFDLVVLLLIPELVSQSVVRDDFSLTTGLIAVATLMLLVFLTSVLSYRFERVERLISSTPTILVRHGELIARNLNHERVPAEEIFDALHQAGLSRLAEVQWAILETDGRITVIPADAPAPGRQTHERHSAI